MYVCVSVLHIRMYVQMCVYVRTCIHVVHVFSDILIRIHLSSYAWYLSIQCPHYKGVLIIGV